MQVQRQLALEGVCSRREAETFLRQGLVLVNGKVARPGTQTEPGKDIVTLALAAQKGLTQKMTVLVYKPRGIVCSHDESEGKTIFQQFPKYKNLNTVGRLDKESEGLILLSNDGLVTKRVTGEDHVMEKEYEIATQEPIFPGKLAPLSRGMKLADGPTLPAKVQILNRHLFRITLREGRKHQIRRMCDKIKITITSLKRIRIGEIQIGKMKPGDARTLTPVELQKLRSEK